MNLREDKGYTYGAGAGFDLRRGAGPFAARAAVNTEVTVPAITESLKELARMREEDVTDAELRAARDFLVGVFPLRFETAGAVVGALSGLVVHDLGIEELIGYRTSIEGVSNADVTAAARAHVLLLDSAAIVVVGDADQFGEALEAAGIGPVVVERDEGPSRPDRCPRRRSRRSTRRTRPGRRPVPRSRTCPGARTSLAAGPPDAIEPEVRAETFPMVLSQMSTNRSRDRVPTEETDRCVATSRSFGGLAFGRGAAAPRRRRDSGEHRRDAVPRGGDRDVGDR